MEEAVLIFVIHKDQVLLAESDYRPNKITWYGISGFVKKGERPNMATMRTLYEAVKLQVYPGDIEQAGVLHLYTIGSNGVKKETTAITIFLIEKFQGQPQMTSGFRPRWFDLDKIPYDKMFEDTKDWLGKILDGEKLVIEVSSRKNEKTNDLDVEEVIITNIIN